MIRKYLATAVAIVFTCAPILSALPQAQTAPPLDAATLQSLAAVAGQAMMEPTAYTYLEQLSDDIGARVTGSPEAQRAIDWGVSTMKSIGLENVHTEAYQVFRDWTRGIATAELVAPIHRNLMVDAMGWVGSTPTGGVEAPLVGVNTYDIDNEIKNNAASWRGKILIAYRKGEPPANRMMGFLKFGDLLKAAQANGAVAVIGGQGGAPSAGMHLTHTGALGFNVSYDIPVVSMSAEDQAQLQRYVDRGVPVRIKINVQNKFSDGPVQSANVIGEIRGTEHPEQILVVGGHLDSWDLAEGTTDNGSGTATALGAADAIVRSGEKPRRTIRFVLFTGEEQGLDGSSAYVKQHQSEMANHLGDLILDAGQGPVKGFQLGGRDDLIAAFQPFARSLANLGPMTVDDKIESGTDTLPFSIAGLPGINMDQDTSEYKFTHHSAADALEAQKPDVLTKNATLMALAAFWIADRPDRFAAPWPAKRTARMLRDQHEYEELKAFNLWPYGDLGAEKDDTPQN